MATATTYSAKKHESSIMIDTAKEILKPLCVNETRERRYGVPLSLQPSPMVTGIRCEDISIGNVKTWHGTPDGRVRGGGSFVLGEEDTSDEHDDDSLQSDGRATTLEAKNINKSV